MKTVWSPGGQTNCLSPGDKQFVCPPGDKLFLHTGEGGTNISHTEEGGGNKHFMLEAVVPMMMLLNSWL